MPGKKITLTIVVVVVRLGCHKVQSFYKAFLFLFSIVLIVNRQMLSVIAVTNVVQAPTIWIQPIYLDALNVSVQEQHVHVRHHVGIVNRFRFLFSMTNSH